MPQPYPRPGQPQEVPGLTCANDPAKSTQASPGHDDFRYVATVDHVQLDGTPDADPADDVYPRSVTPPFEIDPAPCKKWGLAYREADGLRSVGFVVKHVMLGA